MHEIYPGTNRIACCCFEATDGWSDSFGRSAILPDNVLALWHSSELNVPWGNAVE